MGGVCCPSNRSPLSPEHKIDSERPWSSNIVFSLILFFILFAPLQGAKSLDAVSIDEEGPCTTPESVFLDFYLAESHESLTSLILMRN